MGQEIREMLLGGRAKDVNSRVRRETVFNAFVETDRSGEFKRVVRAAGLRLFATAGTGPIRGVKNIRDQLFFVSGQEFFRANLDGDVTKIGNIDNETTYVDIETNGADVGQVIVISRGNGWALESDGTTFGLITDSNFSPDRTVAFLAGRVWLNNPDSNRFFASEVGDLTMYNSVDSALANDESDAIVVMRSVRSNLVVMGSSSIETWQLVNAPFPVRRIVGATKDRGVLSPESVAQFEDQLFFLADDLTVRVYASNQIPEIGNLAINLAIRGDGTPQNPGYSRPDLAEGAFIEDNEHKFYVLTFPADDATWLYDVMTGIWHRRKSEFTGRWRGRVSALFGNKRIIGDFSSNQLFELDEKIHNEAGDVQPMQIVTPPVVSHTGNLFISDIEAYMEVGDGQISNAIPELNILQPNPIEPQMRVEFSRNGGRNYVQRSAIGLGAIGAKDTRVIMRSFGYTKRHFEFVLRLTITDDVPISMYSLYLNGMEGV